jgi:hypothetical protein
MLQLAADLRFFGKPAQVFRVLCMFGQQHFDGDFAPDLVVAPAQHHTHSAARDFTGQPEPLTGGTLRVRKRCGRRNLREDFGLGEETFLVRLRFRSRLRFGLACLAFVQIGSGRFDHVGFPWFRK